MEDRPIPVRVALVDLDWRGLDVFRAALALALKGAGREPSGAIDAEVRLVVAEGPEAPAFLWARLAGVPRAGEIARLGEIVVEAVMLSAASPRAAQAARLSAALGTLVVAVPVPAAAPASHRAGAAS